MGKKCTDAEKKAGMKNGLVSWTIIDKHNVTQIEGRHRSHDFYRCKRYCPLKIKSVVLYSILWLNPRVGKMKRILHFDWIPERARLTLLALSGSPAYSRSRSLVLGQ